MNSLGAAVVNSACKVWLGDRQFAGDVTPELADLFAGRVSSRYAINGDRSSERGGATPQRQTGGKGAGGPLLNRNVLVAGDGSRLVAVFDWGCSAYGDFLYEVAWFTFWAPWHAGLAAIDFRSVMRGHYDATGLDVPFFDERLRCS